MQKTNPFTVSLLIRRARINKVGEAPIFLRISLHKESVELATKHYINPTQWNSRQGKVIGKSPQVKSINEDLSDLILSCRHHYNQLQTAGKTISAGAIKNLLLGKQEKQHTLLALFDKMVADTKALIGQDYTESTYKNYLASQRQLHRFMQANYKGKDIPLQELSYEFISGFELYLKTKGSCTQNGCIKHMQRLRKCITIALHKGYLEKDPFISYSIKKKKTFIHPLTKHELELIEQKEFYNERLNTIKDLFLFTCYTGLAFGDAALLSKEHISLGLDNKEWIFISRKKTGNHCRIPLLTKAKAIIVKYKEHTKVTHTGKLLPVPSNQKFNAYLKEIADLCGITKRLTVHIGRHTFATTVALQSGVPMEVVKEILGHESITTTQLYAKVSDERIAASTQNLT